LAASLAQTCQNPSQYQQVQRFWLKVWRRQLNVLTSRQLLELLILIPVLMTSVFKTNSSSVIDVQDVDAFRSVALETVMTLKVIGQWLLHIKQEKRHPPGWSRFKRVIAA
jgi:hypothetical protein